MSSGSDRFGWFSRVFLDAQYAQHRRLIPQYKGIAQGQQLSGQCAALAFKLTGVMPGELPLFVGVSHIGHPLKQQFVGGIGDLAELLTVDVKAGNTLKETFNHGNFVFLNCDSLQYPHFSFVFDCR